MPRYSKYFIPLFCLFLFCRCNKTTPGNNVYTLVDSAFKANFNYQPGSYWIYRDSLSGRVDSFYVTQNMTAYVTPKWTESINIQVSEKNTDGSHPADSGAWVYTLEGTDAALNYFDSSNELVFAYNPFFIYPPGTAFLYDDQVSDTPVILNTMGSYTVNGNTYSNVTDIEHRATGYPANYFFINDSAGIIKMELSTSSGALSHVWELQRYHIIR